MQDLLANSNAVIGVWMIIFALIMKTPDIISSFVFKVIPFFMGAVLVYNAAKLFGLI